MSTFWDFLFLNSLLDEIKANSLPNLGDGCYIKFLNRNWKEDRKAIKLKTKNGGYDMPFPTLSGSTSYNSPIPVDNADNLTHSNQYFYSREQ